MATHSSFLAWRIPWMEGPGGLQSTGLQRQDSYENGNDLSHEKLFYLKATAQILVGYDGLPSTKHTCYPQKLKPRSTQK